VHILQLKNNFPKIFTNIRRDTLLFWTPTIVIDQGHGGTMLVELAQRFEVHPT